MRGSRQMQCYGVQDRARRGGCVMKITFVGGPLDERTEERRGLGSLYRDDEGHTIPARVGDAEWFPDRSAGHGTWPLPLRARPVPSADRFYLRQRVADEAGVKELAYVHASAWAEWNTRELREIDG